MKLKEAQMLGILALLAVGTVLLCMWGGDEVLDEGALIEADEQMLGSAELQPGVRELLADLMADRQPPAFVSPPDPSEAAVVLGGGPMPPPATEEGAIRTLIDETVPVEIPLVPRRTEPAATGSPPVPARLQPPKPVYHVVQKGDTLSEISQQYYGTSRNHGLIQKANAALVPEAKLLRPGMRLRIPPLEDEAARRMAAASTPALSTSAAKRTYKVQKGDNFWRIAEKCYEDGTKWKDIHAANRTLAPEAASLQPGMVLVIP